MERRGAVEHCVVLVLLHDSEQVLFVQVEYGNASISKHCSQQVPAPNVARIGHFVHRNQFPRTRLLQIELAYVEVRHRYIACLAFQQSQHLGEFNSVKLLVIHVDIQRVWSPQ